MTCEFYAMNWIMDGLRSEFWLNESNQLPTATGLRMRPGRGRGLFRFVRGAVVWTPVHVITVTDDSGDMDAMSRLLRNSFIRKRLQVTDLLEVDSKPMMLMAEKSGDKKHVRPMVKGERSPAYYKA